MLFWAFFFWVPARSSSHQPDACRTPQPPAKPPQHFFPAGPQELKKSPGQKTAWIQKWPKVARNAMLKVVEDGGSTSSTPGTGRRPPRNDPGNENGDHQHFAGFPSMSRGLTQIWHKGSNTTLRHRCALCHQWESIDLSTNLQEACPPLIEAWARL